MASFLPADIWSQNWISTGRLPVLYERDRLHTTVFGSVTAETEAGTLELKERSVSELADALMDLLDDCKEKEDYAPVLAADREFVW